MAEQLKQRELAVQELAKQKEEVARWEREAEELNRSKDKEQQKQQGSMRSAGSLSEFTCKDNWSHWKERFDLFCVVNDIERNKIVPLFLTMIGAETYALLSNLCDPEKVKDKTYEQLSEVMKEHLEPKASIITERYNFKEKRQLEEESIKDTSRDRFVWGLKSDAIKKKLLSEADSTFKKTAEIATAVESAAKDVKKINGIKKNLTNVNYIQDRRMGHLEVVCRKKNWENEDKKAMTSMRKNKKIIKDQRDQNNYVNDVEDKDKELENLFCVEDLILSTESYSIVGISFSQKFYEENKELGEIIPTDRRFKSYQGDVMCPVGVIKVNVSKGTIIRELELFVFPGISNPILGIDWIDALSLFEGKAKTHNFNYMNKKYPSIGELVKEFKDVVSDKLGMYERKVFELTLKDKAKPVYCQPRPLPYAIKDKIGEEIDNLVADGVLEAVESSEWATPIVLILKSDGKIRICGDYKVIVNSQLEVKKHPIPQVQDLFVKLEGERFMCGVASATMKEMEELLGSIEGVVVFYDDIVVLGRTLKEHDLRLKRVLEILIACGLTAKINKCVFGVKSVEFWGYVVSDKGMSIRKERINAIVDIPEPTNNNRKWVWSKEAKRSFTLVKEKLVAHDILAHYDPKLQVKIMCDASPVGIGAVLLQVCDNKQSRPIAFASRTLSKAENNYSQLDKEAVVIPESLRKEVLSEIHGVHLGIVKMKELARSCVWWPKIDTDIENLSKACEWCQEFTSDPAWSMLHVWKYPEGPNDRIHADFFGPIEGKIFMVIVD
ncbi:uncharacterized protein K02A2.6-like [Microplitis mediator]|uniref:uncharacterized protein K02A2.6-like n=1 Tax=Microplitis mediator TaxID=375433 RepID=UPI00255582BD|nr:uncharacterized protein K02A2.6-like [Microplitis mediator]